MDTFKPDDKKGVNKVFLAAIAVAVIIVGAGIYLLTLQPTAEEQKQAILEGALLPGNPEFERISKQIIITTDSDNTIEGTTGLGSIMMSIPATILNKSDKTITLLEVKVDVIDTKKQVLKEKKFFAVPTAKAQTLPPNESVRVVQTLDGFNEDDDRALPRWLVTAIKIQE